MGELGFFIITTSENRFFDRSVFSLLGLFKAYLVLGLRERTTQTGVRQDVSSIGETTGVEGTCSGYRVGFQL